MTIEILQPLILLLRGKLQESEGYFGISNNSHEHHTLILENIRQAYNYDAYSPGSFVKKEGMIFIRAFFASAAFLLIATYCNPLWASSVNPLDLPDLVRKADVIADATVSNLQSYTMWSPEGRTIHTRIALHELGHLLGLDHPDDAGQNVDAIMNSHVSNTDDLTADDIAGVRAIYGP